jgi:hypothetical protein
MAEDKQGDTGDPQNKAGEEDKNPSSEEQLRGRATRAEGKLKEVEAENVKLKEQLEGKEKGDSETERLEKLKQDDPAAYVREVQGRELKEIKDRQLAQEESVKVNEFVKSIPEAEKHADALKRLGRVYPKKSYQELWDENFGSAFSRDRHPEGGEGSISGEPTGDELGAEFDKLPLAKRKEILKRKGLS